jgi:hypothetical protein
MDFPTNPTFLPRYDSTRPGNWFLSSDGTCGDPLDTTLSSQGAFIGFLLLSIIVAAIAGGLNFISLNTKTRQGVLFKHGVYKQTIIDILASLVAPILALATLKKDDDVYTSQNFHVMMWTVLFGFKPGAIMAFLQVFGEDLAGAAAAGQMIADLIFVIVGCAVTLASENGSVVPVAYGKYRGAVFCGVAFFLIHIVMLVGIYLVSRKDRDEDEYQRKYRVFMSARGRVYVFFVGVFSLVGSLVLLIVGSKLCGKLITFLDAMCLLVQAVLSALLAWREAHAEKKKEKSRPQAPYPRVPYQQGPPPYQQGPSQQGPYQQGPYQRVPYY